MLYEEIIATGTITGIFLLMSIILGIILYEISSVIEIFSHMDTTAGALVGVILGACLTYYFSDRQWKKQIKMQKRNVAIGFYCEINDIEQIIESLIKEYKKNKFIDENDIVTIGHFGRLEQMIDAAKIDLNKSNSIYDENGLYFHFRKEIYLFDTDIVKSILKFYRELLLADKEFKIYMKFRSETDNQSLWNAVKVELNFIDHLQKANEETPKLLKYFRNRTTTPN